MTIQLSPVVSVTPSLPAQILVAPGGQALQVVISSVSPVGLSGYLPLTGGMLTGAITSAPVVLTDAATIAVNAAASNHLRVTLGGNRILGTPSNPEDGQKITVEVIQPASGGPCTLAYSAAYEWSEATPAPVLSTAANAHDFLGFIYNANTALWYGVSAAPGY